MIFVTRRLAAVGALRAERRFMKRYGGPTGLVLALVAGLVSGPAPAGAQTAAAERPQTATPESSKPFVVIGCLHRAEGNVFLLTDQRSHIQYEIKSDNRSPATTLGWQAGHVLEIRGPATAAHPPTRRQVTARTVIEISSSCPQSPSPKR